MKDNYQEEIVEHHPFKGWFRHNSMGRLRELWCATTADRMHADPMVCQQIIATAKRSKFLSTLIPFTAPATAPIPPLLTDTVAPSTAVVISEAPASVGTAQDVPATVLHSEIRSATTSNGPDVDIDTSSNAGNNYTIPVSVIEPTAISGTMQ